MIKRVKFKNQVSEEARSSGRCVSDRCKYFNAYWRKESRQRGYCCHWVRKFCTGNMKEWHPTPVYLPGKSHGWRSLVGCSPQGRQESDTTERLHFLFSLSCIREGNGNPLQCSCLENPRDGGAWWAAISGVTQSWTRLK